MPELTTLDDLEQTPHAEVFDDRDPRTVLLRLEDGESVPPHQHPGTDIVMYVIDGELSVRLGDEHYQVTAGDAVSFSGDQDISPEATTAATALLMFAPSADR